MKKIFLLVTLIIFTFNIGITQTKIAGVDTISDPLIYYFLNNLNNLIAQNDSSLNEFKNMFYQDNKLCFGSSDYNSPGCVETVESISEKVYKRISRLTQEGIITFKIKDIDVYHNPDYNEYAGIYDIILSNEKMGVTDHIAIMFGITSPTTFRARSMEYWFEPSKNFLPIKVIELDGSITDKSDYDSFPHIDSITVVKE